MATLMALLRPALAGPVGGTVVDGSAAISQAGTATNINQSTNKAIINWQGFSVGANESVNFYQPGASSVTLNRVIGNETSVINGAINANGQVFIVNSAGVLFGKGAQVNVGGLVASTHDISNSDFMAGNYTFSGTSNAAVVNQGRIRAHGGGYVALLGKTVSNEGVISARLGTVAMAAGEKLTLNFGGDSLVDVTIDKGALNALVSNKRAIIADGGTVIMTARAADQVLSAQVNNSGIVQARTMASLKGGDSSSGGTVKRGKIQLVAAGGNVANTGKLDVSAKGSADAGSIEVLASGGTASIAGRLDATAVNGNGGQIETSGDHVTVSDGTVITTKSAYGKTGNWLIDPDGFTIAATGGDISGTTLGNQLENNDVTIASTDGNGTDGNINVNDAVSWSAATTLTLNATNSINVNAPVAWTTGTLALYTVNNDVNIGASLTGPALVLDVGHNFNLNAPDVLNVAAVKGGDNYGGIYYGFYINAPQNWTTPPDLTRLWTYGIDFNAPVTWSSGTLVLKSYDRVNVNPGGSLTGPTLDLNSYDFNLNAADAFNVATVIGTRAYLGAYGDFNINQPQHWTTPPDFSAWGVAGNVNINAPLTWTSGTLTLSAGNGYYADELPTHNVNINAALNGPSLAFNVPVVPLAYPEEPPTPAGAVNVNAVNSLNVTTISGTVSGGLNFTAAQTWTTLPDMSALGVTGTSNVNAPLTWSAGTLTLQGDTINIGANLSGGALVLDSPGAVSVSAANVLHVATIAGTAGGGFNINAAQTWTAAPSVIVSGDINVNAPLTWSTGALKLAASNNIEINTALGWSSGTLTLNAGKNIYVNATMTASGTANFAAGYGYVLDANGDRTAVATAGSNPNGSPFGLYLATDPHSSDSSAIAYSSVINFSSTGTIAFNGQAATVVNSVAGLDAIAANLSGNYVLGKDLVGLSLADLSVFGFSSGAQFTGNFNGLGHTLTTASLPSFALPSSIATLSNTTLVLNSAGNISINGNVTSGAGILTLNAAALMIAPPATLSGLNLVINASATWTSNAALTFNAYDNLTINSSITATGDSATLTLNANTGIISINNAITLSGANATLTMNYGGDYIIRTPASYSGTTLDANGKLVAQVDPHDPANGGDGIYGSITFTNPANKTGLVINGVTYTLIHSIAELDGIDHSDAQTGKYYNAATGLYDLDDTPVKGSVSAFILWYSGSGTSRTYYNPDTKQYDIPQLDPSGSGKYYNPVTKAYDLVAPDAHTIATSFYVYDPTTGKYSIPNYDGTNYYDPTTGLYTLSSASHANWVMYDATSGKYDVFYDPSVVTVPANFYYNPTTGLYDSGTDVLATGATGNYALAQDIYATSDGTRTGAPITYTSALVSALNGTFAGLGHTISDLTINSTQTNINTNVGLFGAVGQGQASVIRDIGLTNVNISGPGYTAGLVAQVDSTTANSVLINDVYVTGSVAGGNNVGGVIASMGTNSTLTDAFFSGSMGGTVTYLGGLVGSANGNGIVIRNAHANVNDINATIVGTTDGSSLGGLIGYYRSDSNGQISSTYSTGNITLTISDYYAAGVGGLIGNMSQWQFATDGSRLTNSFSSVNIAVTLKDNIQTSIGGLVGNLSSSHIDNVYATGGITIDAAGGQYNAGPVGGLVGQASGTPTYISTITNAAAYGTVSELSLGHQMGGFIGWSSNTTISDSQAYGDVITPAFGLAVSVGGFAGGNAGTILNSVAYGKVIVTPGPLGEQTNGWIGGFVGTNTSGATITNSYYNGEANSAPVGPGNSAGVGLDYTGNANPTGLTNAQLKDAPYYLNGTINQVLADRAAAKATAEAAAKFQADAVRTGSVISSGPDVSSAPTTTAAAISAMQNSAKLEALDDGLKDTEQQVKKDDERRTRERTAAAARTNRSGGSGGGYGATIRRIDVDGQRFNLENNNPPGGGGNGAPGSNGGAR